MASGPRLRVFAGPNGSGKSTLKDVLPADWLGVYVNADDIEKTLRLDGILRLSAYAIYPTQKELVNFLSRSTLLNSVGLKGDVGEIYLEKECIVLRHLTVNSYHASVLADFIRHQVLRSGLSMTFETVMSSPDKIAFIRKAQIAGYRTYLYFVATEDPLINISRVSHRVKTGGHDVPSDKVIARYARSLDLLFDAIACTNRAYVFDNSGDQRVWIAEVTDGQVLELKTDNMPYWFMHAVLDRF
jgi:predicted ABC-type ATPase